MTTTTRRNNYSAPEGFYTAADAARILGVNKQTLYALRHRGKGPQGQKIDGRLLYSTNALRTWLNDRREGTCIPFEPPRTPARPQAQTTMPPQRNPHAVIDMSSFMDKFVGRKKSTSKATNYALRKEFRELLTALKECSKAELFQLLETAMVEFSGRKDWHPKRGELVQFSHLGRMLMGCVQKLNKKTATVMAHTREGKQFLRVDYTDLTPAPEDFDCQIRRTPRADASKKNL